MKLNFENILGSVSPLYGALSGHGLMNHMLGSVSPMYGMLSGKGLFGGGIDAGQGDLDINGLLAHLFMQAMK